MIKCNSFAFIVLVCIFGYALAQSQSTAEPETTTDAATTLAPQLKYECRAAQGISFNQTELFGFLFEVARQPVNKDLGCVQVSTHLLHDNTTLSTNVTFSTTPSTWYTNITESANITLVANQTTGYNVTFTHANTPAFIKLLELYTTPDGVKWVAGCSFSNASAPSSVFAFLLSSAQNVNQTGLNYVYNLAAQKYADFTPVSTNVTMMNQKNCYMSSASTAVPLLTGFVAVLFVLLKSLGMA